MVKKHRASRIIFLSIEDIQNTSEVILQAEETGEKFEDGKHAYLCEVLHPCNYNREDTAERLAEELVKANVENSFLRRRVDRLNKELQKARAGA